MKERIWEVLFDDPENPPTKAGVAHIIDDLPTVHVTAYELIAMFQDAGIRGHIKEVCNMTMMRV